MISVNSFSHPSTSNHSHYVQDLMQSYPLFRRIFNEAYVPTAAERIEAELILNRSYPGVTLDTLLDAARVCSPYRAEPSAPPIELSKDEEDGCSTAPIYDPMRNQILNPMTAPPPPVVQNKLAFPFVTSATRKCQTQQSKKATQFNVIQYLDNCHNEITLHLTNCKEDDLCEGRFDDDDEDEDKHGNNEFGLREIAKLILILNQSKNDIPYKILNVETIRHID